MLLIQETPNSMDTNNREDVAYHEAAHVVASVATRRSFMSVTTTPDDKRAGHVRHRAIKDTSLRSDRCWLDHAFICLAAPAFDYCKHGTYSGVGCSTDIDQALTYLGQVAGDNMGIDADMDIALQAQYDAAWARAVEFAKDPRRQAQIDLVAQALIEHDSLTRKQVLELLKK